MVQRQSEGERHGDQNPDHVAGLQLAADYIYFHKKNDKWEVEHDGNWEEKFDWIFMYLNDFPSDRYPGYKPDIVVYERIIFHGELHDMPVLFVEIDGKKHDTMTQQIKDGIYDKWIYYHYNDAVEVIRLKTAEMNGPRDLALEYVAKMLRGYCK